MMNTFTLIFLWTGHSDVVMGAVITSNDSLHEKLRFLQYGKETKFG